MRRAGGGGAGLALLFVVTAAVCLPAVDAPFTYDERAGIADNRAVHPGAPLSAALRYRFSPDQMRPLFFASLWADAQLWGTTPRPYRLTDIALHLMAGLLIYLLLRRGLAAPPAPAGAGPPPIESLVRGGALAGAALFLLHPLQSESIFYVWGRSALLSTLFGVAALLLAPVGGSAGASGARRAARWAAALLLVGCGLACKEEAIVWPLIALLWWTGMEARRLPAALRGTALLSIPVGVFLLARVALLGAPGRQVYARGPVDNLLGQAVVTLRMLRMLILPIGQSVDPQAEMPGPIAGLAALLACAFLAGLAIVYVRPPRPGAVARLGRGGVTGRRVAAGALIGAAGMLIYWLVPLPDLMSERRAYLPMLGAAIIVALAGERLVARGTARVPSPPGWALRAAPYLPALVLTLLLAPALYARAHVWSDSRTLWEEAARLGPRRVRPLINLGVLAAESGNRKAAAAYLDRALRLDPRDAEALFNRARLRQDAGDLDGARADLETAAAVAPALTRIWINLGVVRLRQGDRVGAEAALRTALAIDPGAPRALANLAELLRATGRVAEALPLYRRALAADPSYAYAAIRLGVALEASGDLTGALAAYRDGLRRGPDTPADREAVVAKIKALEERLAASSR
jgi:protein O-mannosyl-transferase